MSSYAMFLLFFSVVTGRPSVEKRLTANTNPQLSPNQFISPNFTSSGTNFQPQQFLNPSFQQNGNNTNPNFMPSFIDPSQFFKGTGGTGGSSSSGNSSSTSGGIFSPQQFINPFSSGGNSSSFSFIDPGKFIGKRTVK
ncbi:Hypothetical predicted protein [Mytilus galloprovincialis]|uniref:Uncharacterized protein n=1 Tax=Mytilus galloprovincialis TaxID=29158 RepID=A0A8B6BY33_MYTGA|nr:Hypothetical predicted protein [Mytilus galloprovincialis]